MPLLARMLPKVSRVMAVYSALCPGVSSTRWSLTIFSGARRRWPGRSSGAAGERGRRRRFRSGAARNAFAAPNRPGFGPVQDGPQISEAVLDRRAGDRDPQPRVQVAEGRGLHAARVLDVLRLVGHNQVEGDPAELVHVTQECSVAGAGRCRRPGGRSGRGPAPWWRRTGTLGANLAISRSQLVEQGRRRTPRSRDPPTGAGGTR